MTTVDRRCGVLGDPIAHSLSPVLHNAGYAAAGLSGWSYTAIECAEAELADLVAGLGPEWAGLSLTMPLKEAGLAVAGEVSPVAAAVGAANTLVRREPDLWYADNTDVAGMVAVLREAGVSDHGQGGGGQGGGDQGRGVTVTVLGAGGTARAALAAAAALGATSVTVAARRAEAVEALRPVAARLGVPLTGAAWPTDRATDRPTARPTDSAARGALLTADVVISTVPKGVADPLAADARWGPSTVYFDALYDPWPTPLAAAAVAAGRRTVSGLDLLLAQALGQFAQFTGVPAPVEAMRAALWAARSAVRRGEGG
jgi:shikimate dehydrogenase